MAEVTLVLKALHLREEPADIIILPLGAVEADAVRLQAGHVLPGQSVLVWASLHFHMKGTYSRGMRRDVIM